MILTKEHWNKNDISDFQNYLLSFSKGVEKSIWEKRIVNTNLPCIAVPSTKVSLLVRQIMKGNFKEFLELWIWENHTNTIIIGSIISKIKDFDLMANYLKKYASMCDNWATCDVLKFNITENNAQDFFNLAKSYVQKQKTFEKRIGYLILLKLVNFNAYIDKIFEILNNSNQETEYYVNMIKAWLLCECFVKHRLETLSFLENSNLDKFTINKAISKCRDSFRVSDEDKALLLKYKVK